MKIFSRHLILVKVFIATMASANFNSNDRSSWDFGAFDRKKTIDKLQGQIHGTFLVRDSKTCPGDLVLSVSENSKVSHYIINKLGNRLKIGDQEFSGIEELLDFYKVHYLDTTTLIQPARKDNTSEDTVDGMIKPMPVVAMNGPTNNIHDNYPAQPSMVKLQVRALFDFKGNDKEDLPFKKGEVLEIVAKPEENWWTARNSAGVTGQIPVPYVEKYVNRPTSNVHYPPNGEKKAAENRISLPDIRNHPIFATVTMKRVPSAYDPSALALEVGDIVKVTKMNPNGQWEGEIKDRKGIFPFTHVKVLDNYQE